MSQEYTVRDFRTSDFQDNYGNTWCDASFTEFGEPVKWVVKDPSRIEIGMKVYGHIEEATSKAGRPYNRFKTDKREDESLVKGAAYSENPERQDSIHRSVALNNAVGFVNENNVLTVDEVLETAEKFLKWLKNETITSEDVKEVFSGYDKAKAAAKKLKEPLPDLPPDLDLSEDL